ncbi:MAG: SDR family oxidoreductase [Acutalibacteraceae bacterium]|nr:SDR family oxidoreductase [Acutalibacteraceae bacterium]
MKNNRLNNKTVIITGASSGIGRGIAIKLIKEYNCTVLGIARSKEKMERLSAELGTKTEKFSYCLFDVSSKENWKNYRLYLEEKGIKPDILINNAGILPEFKKAENIFVEEIEDTMNINFYGAVYSVKELLPLILKSSTPAVVNIDSSAALMPLAGTAAYSASKAALKAFTEAIREELRGRCYVGLICPGFTKTDIFRSQNLTEKREEKIIRIISTSCDYAVNRIVKSIARKRELTVIGTDAQFMKLMGKIMPVKGGKLISAILKKSGFKLFNGLN